MFQISMNARRILTSVISVRIAQTCMDITNAHAKPTTKGTES